MNIEQAINYLKAGGMSDEQIRTIVDAFTCEDCISRQAVLEPYQTLKDSDTICIWLLRKNIEQQPPVTPQSKTGQCNSCRWQKDSDGVYRRGIGAESICPINCLDVFGNGYCYIYKPKI